LASLLSFLNILLKKIKFSIKIILKFLEKLSSKKTRPKLVSGFTLIELVVYMALFSIMMGGLIVVVFQLMQSSENLSSKDTAQEEINFVMNKISWALTDASSVTTSTTTTANDTLNIVSFSGGKKIFRLNNGQRIEFCQSATSSCSTYNFLTTLNVKVLGLEFSKILTTPLGINIDLNINGIINTYIKYLKI